MDLAIQIIANDKTVRSDTVQALGDFSSQSVSTQAKKREQLNSKILACRLLKKLSIY